MIRRDDDEYKPRVLAPVKKWEVARWHNDDGDNPRKDALTRFIARMKRKPASWCPGGWYDPEAPRCRKCEFNFKTESAHNCESICSCSCLAIRLRRVHAMFEAERMIKVSKQVKAKVDRINSPRVIDPDLAYYGYDMSHLYEPFPEGR